MKRFLKSGLLVLCLLAVGASVQAKSVALSYKYAKGQTDKYKLVMDMKMKMTGMPGAPAEPITVKISMSYTQRVLKVNSDGSADVKMSFQDIKGAVPGLGNPLPPMPKDMSMTLTMGADGSIIKVINMDKGFGSGGMPGVDMSQMMNQMMNQMGQYSNFPKGQIEVGQTWSQDIPFLDMGSLKAVSVLDAAATPYGKGSASKIATTINGTIDVAKLMAGIASTAQDPNVRKALAGVTGAINIGGNFTTFFSPSLGKMLRTAGTITEMMTMNMPIEATSQGAPATINITMDIGMNVVRID